LAASFSFFVEIDPGNKRWLDAHTVEGSRQALFFLKLTFVALAPERMPDFRGVFLRWIVKGS
jgi:hypothetical protein